MNCRYLLCSLFGQVFCEIKYSINSSQLRQEKNILIRPLSSRPRPRYAKRSTNSAAKKFPRPTLDLKGPQLCIEFAIESPNSLLKPYDLRCRRGTRISASCRCLRSFSHKLFIPRSQLSQLDSRADTFRRSAYPLTKRTSKMIPMMRAMRVCAPLRTGRSRRNGAQEDTRDLADL